MSKRILICDDEAQLRLTLRTRLESWGYKVLECTDGKQALELLENEIPDLILMDVMMPPPNGYQTCRQIKDNVNLKNIPVIMLTAKGSDSDKFWGQESGADSYVVKPYSAEVLQREISRHIKS
ncbi:MAG: hypothetical protein A2Z83_02040 [Omnitrophica bacterium GWA2_52_8]|nr:MAG: hypothetical protein A2Z83_02040 [Omnitrophica bacterium GWA2_52_8]